MKKQFEILRLTRKNTVALLEGCSKEQLTTIPANYNNNVLWNAAHNLVTLQLLCYKLSENKVNLDSSLIDTFRKGTKATENLKIDVEELKTLLISTADQLEEDYNKGLFKKDFDSYPTSYGFTLNSIEDAITFNNLHEGIHFGYMLAQKKAI